MTPARQEYTEVVSYSQAHLRLKKDRGRPSGYACSLCGGTAREWAYMGGDPDELQDDAGRRYSLDQSLYSPMCRVCHRRHDRAVADGRSMDVCPHGHEWTPENTGIRRNRGRRSGIRYCRACQRANTARWQQAQKLKERA